MPGPKMPSPNSAIDANISASAWLRVGSDPAVVWNWLKIVDPMPTITANTSTLIPDDTTLPRTRSARNAVLFHRANGTSTKPASVVSLNSSNVTKSCTANTKKLTTTTSQAKNNTTMVSRFRNTSGKPDSCPIFCRIGWPAVTPTAASRPGCSSCDDDIPDPEATRPSPANERNTMPARLLKLPMM